MPSAGHPHSQETHLLYSLRNEMNVTAPSRSISLPSRSADPVANLVIETLDEFATGVYAFTSTTADYISGTPSAAYN
jgi:hypothetical protein